MTNSVPAPETMTLFHSVLSSDSRKVVLTLHELGFSRAVSNCETCGGRFAGRRTVCPFDGTSLVPPGGPVVPDVALVAVDPFSEEPEPVLVLEGARHTGAHELMVFLAEAWPSQRLWPREPVLQNPVKQWLDWCATALDAPIAGLMEENFWKGVHGAEIPDAGRVAAHAEATTVALEHLDRRLHRRAFIASGEMSLADLAVAAPLMNSSPAGIDLRGRGERCPMAGEHRVQALLGGEPPVLRSPDMTSMTNSVP